MPTRGRGVQEEDDRDFRLRAMVSTAACSSPKGDTQNIYITYKCSSSQPNEANEEEKKKKKKKRRKEKRGRSYKNKTPHDTGAKHLQVQNLYNSRADIKLSTVLKKGGGGNYKSFSSLVFSTSL